MAKKSVLKSTSRKISVIGQQEYINRDTGQIESFQVLRIEDVDANFQKIWLWHVLEAIDEIGNAKMKVLWYILEKRNAVTNTLIKTIREISQETGISLDTITRTLKALEKHNIIKRKTGAIFLNPHVIFKGGYNHRMKVLIDYMHFDNQQLEKELDKQHTAEATA